jgi:hypothetical protein
MVFVFLGWVVGFGFWVTRHRIGIPKAAERMTLDFGTPG